MDLKTIKILNSKQPKVMSKIEEDLEVMVICFLQAIEIKRLQQYV